jgi:triacylglycerol lipase
MGGSFAGDEISGVDASGVDALRVDALRVDALRVDGGRSVAERRAAQEFGLQSRPLAGPIRDMSLLRQSLLFAELSELAYRAESVVRDIAPVLGLSEVTFFERSGAQAYLFANETDAVIVCRGTEIHEWNDVRADLNALSVVAETVGKVHRGFKREVDELWPCVERELSANARALWFAGHSLGGAMALICAGRCKVSSIPSDPAAAFTFGGPRVGNKRYVNHCQFPRFRWVNNNDIVTRVPPVWLGYRHTGREFYIDWRGRLRRLARWQRRRDRWRGLWHGIRNRRLDPLSDHAMSAYIAAIAEAVRAEESGKDVLAASERWFQRALHRWERVRSRRRNRRNRERPAQGGLFL